MEYVKYLGILIDQHLKSHFQIESLIKSTRYLLYILSKLIKIKSSKWFLKIYYGLSYSLATYHNSTSNPSTKVNFNYYWKKCSKKVINISSTTVETYLM